MTNHIPFQHQAPWTADTTVSGLCIILLQLCAVAKADSHSLRAGRASAMTLLQGTTIGVTLLESKTGSQRRSHHCGSCTVTGRWLVLNATYTPPAALRWLRGASLSSVHELDPAVRQGA